MKISMTRPSNCQIWKCSTPDLAVTLSLWLATLDFEWHTGLDIAYSATPEHNPSSFMSNGVSSSTAAPTRRLRNTRQREERRGRTTATPALLGGRRAKRANKVKIETPPAHLPAQDGEPSLHSQQAGQDGQDTALESERDRRAGSPLAPANLSPILSHLPSRRTTPPRAPSIPDETLNAGFPSAEPNHGLSSSSPLTASEGAESILAGSPSKLAQPGRSSLKRKRSRPSLIPGDGDQRRRSFPVSTHSGYNPVLPPAIPYIEPSKSFTRAQPANPFLGPPNRTRQRRIFRASSPLDLDEAVRPVLSADEPSKAGRSILRSSSSPPQSGRTPASRRSQAPPPDAIPDMDASGALNEALQDRDPYQSASAAGFTTQLNPPPPAFERSLVSPDARPGYPQAHRETEDIVPPVAEPSRNINVALPQPSSASRSSPLTNNVNVESSALSHDGAPAAGLGLSGVTPIASHGNVGASSQAAEPSSRSADIPEMVPNGHSPIHTEDLIHVDPPLNREPHPPQGSPSRSPHSVVPRYPSHPATPSGRASSPVSEGEQCEGPMYVADFTYPPPPKYAAYGANWLDAMADTLNQSMSYLKHEIQQVIEESMVIFAEMTLLKQEVDREEVWMNKFIWRIEQICGEALANDLLNKATEEAKREIQAWELARRGDANSDATDAGFEVRPLEVEDRSDNPHEEPVEPVRPRVDKGKRRATSAELEYEDEVESSAARENLSDAAALVMQASNLTGSVPQDDPHHRVATSHHLSPPVGRKRSREERECEGEDVQENDRLQKKHNHRLSR
ncbi:hypothetical protein GLOTRDRAFT_95888 [Gloeophyllum trabeum ATCC 11539]|uniref:Uncharacterized protein n=1 Tax=Gloeophyllum trabeum (strain ATCC 11539 / FP-39264 / Madison 617) TaxID=670483 RepID=S7PXL9_GLOTA|nr:uncharacterized protein GLOTRDRAFT_95888 [Gloeophyllum trabeum ATCC 11539]EPQ52263.1 hypothetical protein GLOTRDRAFT_95888 [Gloeophyllum trabeum ATCC 11539]